MPSQNQKIILTLTRISLGWLFFYAGITKVLNPDWSATGYLNNAQTLPDFFAWLASPEILPIIDILNEWGLTLIGLSLIFGAFVRLSSILGAILMLLYYLPILNFPKAGDHSFIVDEHIIYILVLLILYSLNAGIYWGLDKFRR